jgi:hypothetical protein
LGENDLGVALYPVFERDVPGYDPSTGLSGKALAQAVDAGHGPLEATCRAIGVTPIFGFYHETNSESFEKIGEEVPANQALDEPQWFDPDDGLRTVSGLLECADAERMEPRLLGDLVRLQQVLEIAKNHGTGFRLRLDI